MDVVMCYSMLFMCAGKRVLMCSWHGVHGMVLTCSYVDACRRLSCCPASWSVPSPVSHTIWHSLLPATTSSSSSSSNNSRMQPSSP
jgi:hypothetical protein